MHQEVIVGPLVAVFAHTFRSVEYAELAHEVQADNIDGVLRKMKVAVHQGVWMESALRQDKTQPPFHLSVSLTNSFL